MGKNHHLHLTLNKKSKLKIKEEAEKLKIPMTEYCRMKIIGDSQLDRIEKVLEILLKSQ